jgi:hypothetical protein
MINSVVDQSSANRSGRGLTLLNSLNAVFRAIRRLFNGGDMASSKAVFPPSLL